MRFVGLKEPEKAKKAADKGTNPNGMKEPKKDEVKKKVKD